MDATGRDARRRSPPLVLDPVALLDAVAHGDVDAFARLHDLVAPLVTRVTVRVVRDTAIAAEVAQEVMLEIWVKAPVRVTLDQSPLAWIATIAHRRAIDRVRSEQADLDRQHRDARRSPHQGRGDPTADGAAERIEWEQMTAALDVLTPRQRQVVDLAFYEGLTYAEVARRLDIPLGTVKTRIRDALIRLRRSLVDTDVLPPRG